MRVIGAKAGILALTFRPPAGGGPSPRVPAGLNAGRAGLPVDTRPALVI